LRSQQLPFWSRNFPPFMEPDGPLSCSQSVPCHTPDEFANVRHISFNSILIKACLPTYTKAFQVISSRNIFRIRCTHFASHPCAQTSSPSHPLGTCPFSCPNILLSNLLPHTFNESSSQGERLSFTLIQSQGNAIALYSLKFTRPTFRFQYMYSNQMVHFRECVRRVMQLD
jgi:hypothetical protein